MSLDLERYAKLYGKLGDRDIENLLQKAAKLSRKRGRPEVVIADHSPIFTLSEEEYVRDLQEHLALQEAVVGFFKQEAPVGTAKTLPELAVPFHRRVGASLPHEVTMTNLLLPAHIRTTTDRREKALLQESKGVAAHIKTGYNHIIQACMRAGLLQVGDVRNIVNLDGELPMRSMTPYIANFLKVAL